MRPQLLVGGLVVALLGAVFYAMSLFVGFELFYAWSIALAAGGGLMCLVSLFMSESPGPVKPPEGFRFCVFCSTPVSITSERCAQCNGLQPKEGA
ncbi:MAG: hypothetical protein ACLQEQ_05325 [Nitrososphaerales archaeon]